MAVMLHVTHLNPGETEYAGRRTVRSLAPCRPVPALPANVATRELDIPDAPCARRPRPPGCWTTGSAGPTSRPAKRARTPRSSAAHSPRFPNRLRARDYRASCQPRSNGTVQAEEHLRTPSLRSIIWATQRGGVSKPACERFSLARTRAGRLRLGRRGHRRYDGCPADVRGVDGAAVRAWQFALSAAKRPIRMG